MSSVPQDCYGFAPAYYHGQADPPSIEWSGYAALIVTIYFGLVSIYDYICRRSTLKGKAPPGEKNLVLKWGYAFFHILHSCLHMPEYDNLECYANHSILQFKKRRQRP